MSGDLNDETSTTSTTSAGSGPRGPTISKWCIKRWRQLRDASENGVNRGFKGGCKEFYETAVNRLKVRSGGQRYSWRVQLVQHAVKRSKQKLDGTAGAAERKMSNLSNHQKYYFADHCQTYAFLLIFMCWKYKFSWACHMAGNWKSCHKICMLKVSC